MPNRLLIVEDHPLFAEALQFNIRSAMPDVHLARATTLNEAKVLIHQEIDFDLVLLDLWLPDAHGFEGLIELRRLFPKLPIVISSASADPSVIHKAVALGAADFVPKSANKAAFLRAIHNVLAVDAPLPDPDHPPRMVEGDELGVLTSKLSSLSRQQLRVLQMLCQGRPNKQIAHSLDIAETTVKAHVTKILRKLGVCSRTRAVIEVSRLNLSAVLALYTAEDVNGSLPACRNDSKSLL